MIVDFEFLDSEPILNVITSLNYKIDKTVFFGYFDMIEKQKAGLERFLNKYCGDQIIEFIPVKRNNLKKILSVMREAIEKERQNGSTVFFDVTGGEAMPLVAFGILSSETETPIHVYSVESGRLKEQEDGAGFEISKVAPQRHVEFDIEALIELMGGTIKRSAIKGNKLLEDEESIDAANRLVEVFEANIQQWTTLAKTFNKVMKNDGEGLLSFDETVVSPLQGRRIKRLIYGLVEKGLMEELEEKNGKKRYKVLNESVYKNLIEEGAILELRTCLKLKEEHKYVMAGVNVDWNGDFYESNNVENEVDVIALDGFVPIIVSCKAGSGIGKETLYELEAVANRFGGRYARKKLVTAHPLNPTTEKRAKEMGIELEVLARD